MAIRFMRILGKWGVLVVFLNKRKRKNIRPATSQNTAVLIDLCLLGLLISLIVAFVNSCKSFYYQEKSKKKYIGGLGSLILLYLLFYIIG